LAFALTSDSMPLPFEGGAAERLLDAHKGVIKDAYFAV
jgi:hypothetical protein